MSKNIIKTSKGTVIFNGGDPLPGCPENWDNALKWVDAVNEGRDKEYVPIWSWDSGFKLDFDGALFSIRSRFYPPKTHYGNTWDGSVGVCFQGTELCKREFDCKTLDELKDEVENYVKKVGENIKKMLIDYFSENNA